MHAYMNALTTSPLRKLFKGSGHSIWKSVDIDNGWLRHVWVARGYVWLAKKWPMAMYGWPVAMEPLCHNG